MKKSILALMFLSTCVLQAMGADKPQEKFNFAGLPSEVQNLIIEQTWADIDTIENMKQLTSSASVVFHKTETSFSEQRKYGFHGFKVPIIFYTLLNGQPCISTVGTILDQAQPSIAWGLLYRQSHSRSTELFIVTPEDTVLSTASISLKVRNHPKICPDTIHIQSASFSVLGKLAIIWQEGGNNERFLTIFNLKDIQDKKEFDLYQNAIKFDKPLDNDDNLAKKLMSPTGPLTKIAGSVFNLDGSKLVTHFKSIFGYQGGFTFDDMREIPNDQPLTIHEKAKRLGVATVGARALIDYRKIK